MKSQPKTTSGKTTNSRQQRFEQLRQQISEKLRDAGITEEIALATLPEARKRVYERHYGRMKGSK